MPLRTLPPAYSPVSLRSIVRGLGVAGTGSQLKRVEALLRAAHGGAFVRLTDSGTSALREALETAVRTRPGPVAIPAYGCYDLLTAAHGAGVVVAFYDLDPETLAPDLDSLRQILDVGTRTVVVAHLYGLPVDLGPIARLVEQRGAWLIEDAAQGQGAELRGQPLGSFGDASVLSFARGKGWTGGGGGALLAHSPDFAEALRVEDGALASGPGLRSVARALGQWLFGRPSLYAIPMSLPFLGVGDTIYRDPRPVRRMAPATGGILEANREASSREAAIRRARAGELRERLVGLEGLRLVSPPPHATAGYLRLPVLIDPALGLDRHDRSLHRLGVAPGYPDALPDVRPRASDLTGACGEGARILVERLWTLPTHGRVHPDDVSAIVGALRSRT